MSSTPARPAGSNTINPFLMTDDAARIIDFVIEVFRATDVPEARTVDTDGLILHSELRIGDSVITVADRKPDWPFTPDSYRCTSTTSRERSHEPSDSAPVS